MATLLDSFKSELIISIAMGNTLIHRSIFHLGSNNSAYANGGNNDPPCDSWRGMNPDIEMYSRKIKTLPARNLTIYDSTNMNEIRAENGVHTLPPTKNKFKRIRNTMRGGGGGGGEGVPTMATNSSGKGGNGESTPRMLFLLYLIHRTWNVLTDSNGNNKNNNKQR